MAVASRVGAEYGTEESSARNWGYWHSVAVHDRDGDDEDVDHDEDALQGPGHRVEPGHPARSARSLGLLDGRSDAPSDVVSYYVDDLELLAAS